jgi:hypothetical protein
VGCGNPFRSRFQARPIARNQDQVISALRQPLGVNRPDPRRGTRDQCRARARRHHYLPSAPTGQPGLEIYMMTII